MRIASYLRLSLLLMLLVACVWVTPAYANFTLLQKTTDENEVLPGGNIHFTVRVQNVLLRVIDDAQIVERFDPSLLTIVQAGSAVQMGSGSLSWTLPRLAPGAVWEKEYVLAAHESVQHGTVLSTIATITGTDILDGPLQDQVVIAAVNVVSTLPTAGAPFDLLFLSLSLPLAVACTGVQRRRMRLKRNVGN